MKNETVAESSTTTRLRHRIMQLNAQKAEQEDILRRDMREVIHAFTPTNIIKNTVHDLRKDPEFKQDAIKQGISIGTGLLLDAIVFRKGFGLKSSLISVGLKRVIGHFLAKRRGG